MHLVLGCGPSMPALHRKWSWYLYLEDGQHSCVPLKNGWIVSVVVEREAYSSLAVVHQKRLQKVLWLPVRSGVVPLLPLLHLPPVLGPDWSYFHCPSGPTQVPRRNPIYLSVKEEPNKFASGINGQVAGGCLKKVLHSNARQSFGPNTQPSTCWCLPASGVIHAINGKRQQARHCCFYEPKIRSFEQR